MLQYQFAYFLSYILQLIIFQKLCYAFRDEQKKLQQKLKSVESKLIVGGVNLVS